jgi:hypothetical protein
LGQQFDTVRDFLCTNNTPTSAHYVAQEGLVACIVSPDNCAFHAGNAEGNTFSVGIECRPEATDGDYQTVGELVAFIRGIYGDVPLYPHNHWFSTACPGAWDLNRIDQIARGIAPAPAPQEDDLSQEQFDTIIKEIQASRTVNQQIEDVTRSLINAVAARLDKGITISRTQAEDIVAATTARVNDYTGKSNARIAAAQAPVPAPVDVAGLAQQLAPLLNANTVDALVNAIKAQWAK